MWRFLGTLLLGATLTCEGARSTPTAEPKDVVARGEGVVVTAAEVAEVAHQTHVSPRQALEAILAFELLASEAARQGFALTREDQEELKRREVQKFVTQVIEPQLDPSHIKEADIRALYEKGRGQFVHPRLVKVALLAVFTGARMKAPARARQEATARDVAALIGAQRADVSPELFGKVGHDPAWIARQVSYGEIWQAADGDHPYPLAFGRAVAALHRQGDTTPLICEESGCYLARYLDERPAENVPFEAVAVSLRTKMAEPWQRGRFKELVAALAGPHDIVADPDLLSAVKIEASDF